DGALHRQRGFPLGAVLGLHHLFHVLTRGPGDGDEAFLCLASSFSAIDVHVTVRPGRCEELGPSPLEVASGWSPSILRLEYLANRVRTKQGIFSLDQLWNRKHVDAPLKAFRNPVGSDHPRDRPVARVPGIQSRPKMLGPWWLPSRAGRASRRIRDRPRARRGGRALCCPPAEAEGRLTGVQSKKDAVPGTRDFLSRRCALISGTGRGELLMRG